ncbi:50S ribosomal protein L5 [bacterium F16]|nr:50S ribosomal protein L5 [bacterium F16]
MSIMKEEYLQTIQPKLKEKHGYTNVHQIPEVKKVVLSSGIGSEKDREVFEETVRLFKEITGQHPVTCKARKSVANFKLREGTNVGVKVTLRGKKMYDFLYRLLRVSLPRVRDFRGVSGKAFDGQGNYSMGIDDQSIFTEINLDKMKHTIGMNIAIVTSAASNEECYDLLQMMGMPFTKKESDRG